MGQPHKHAELIKAWADGAEIQYKFKDKWHDYEGEVNWSIVDMEYRIKPKKIRYRVALLKFDNDFVPNVIEDKNYNTCHQWLSDWIEVEV